MSRTSRSGRRRVVRPSTAENIDRSMDSPHHNFVSDKSAEDIREVIVDDAVIDTSESSLVEDMERERPPHHGQ